jgi:hypothetical protein
MSIKSRTIDNLGMDASVRYAKDKQLYEPQFIEESKLVPQKTEVSVLKPYIPNEFEQLFSLGKQVPWATFSAPPNYYAQSKPLFSYQLIPSLGSYEKQDANTDKLESLQDALQKPYKKKKEHNEEDEKEEEEEERQTLLALFQCIQKLDKTLSLINSRRNQYQRG